MTDLEESIKKLDEKLGDIFLILQKFGLDFITKIGQTTKRVSTLEAKVDKLNKVTTDIAGLFPQLNKIIENQKYVKEEIDLLKSLIMKSTTSLQPKDLENKEIERDNSITTTKQAISEEFQVLKGNIDEIKDPAKIIEKLDDLKEALFEATGGHRILYEISQVVNKLKSDPFDDTLKNLVKDKISFWINKI